MIVQERSEEGNREYMNHVLLDIIMTVWASPGRRGLLLSRSLRPLDAGRYKRRSMRARWG